MILIHLYFFAGDKAMLEQRLNKLENLLSGKQEGEVKINITTGKLLCTGKPSIDVFW